MIFIIIMLYLIVSWMDADSRYREACEDLRDARRRNEAEIRHKELMAKSAGYDARPSKVELRRVTKYDDRMCGDEAVIWFDERV